MVNKRLLAVCLTLGLSVCGAADAAPVKQTPRLNGVVPAVTLTFQEQEPGTEVYTTRTVVTDRFLRIDDGGPGDDFILLDRQARVIYDANSADRTIMVIAWRPRPMEAPIALQLDERIEPLKDAPQIADHGLEHRSYWVNGRRCYDTISVPGYNEDVATALAEYRRVLASEHRRVLPRIPSDQHEACDLAHNVFAAERHLAHGLPVQEWGVDGYRRTLLNIDPTFQALGSLFLLPEDFTRYTLE